MAICGLTPNTRRSPPGNLQNILIYQMVWFGSVYGVGAGSPLLGPLLALGAIGWHLCRCRNPRGEFALLIITTLVGAFWDSLLVQFGLIHYATGNFVEGFAPLWIIALWPAFATTFNYGLRWLAGRDGWAALFGLIGGPLAWWAGERFGALELVEHGKALVALGFGWMVLMPILLRLARFCVASDLADGSSHDV